MCLVDREKGFSFCNDSGYLGLNNGEGLMDRGKEEVTTQVCSNFSV